MKRLLALVLISILALTPTAFAANKTPTVKGLKLLTTIGPLVDFGGLVESGDTLFVFGNKGESAYLRALGIDGKELWSLSLDDASPSVVTAGTVDSNGLIWLAGLTSLKRATPSPTPTVTPLDPDVVVNVPETFKADLDAFSLWSINPVTRELKQQTLQLISPVLINAIAVDKSGIVAVGSSGMIIRADLAGNFSAPLTIGKEGTSFESVVRNKDNSLTVVGSSTETLGGKKVVGKVDGIIMKIATTNKITSIIRSTATGASRSWNSATSSLLLGGHVKTGAKSQSAVTKFSSTFVPTWTYRFASTGTTFTSGATFVFIESTGAVDGLKGWAPKTVRPLLINFDSKGAIAGAFSAPIEEKQVLGLVSTADFGLLCLTSSADTVSIFTLN